MTSPPFIRDKINSLDRFSHAYEEHKIHNYYRTDYYLHSLSRFFLELDFLQILPICFDFFDDFLICQNDCCFFFLFIISILCNNALCIFLWIRVSHRLAVFGCSSALLL